MGDRPLIDCIVQVRFKSYSNNLYDYYSPVRLKRGDIVLTDQGVKVKVVTVLNSWEKTRATKWLSGMLFKTPKPKKKRHKDSMNNIMDDVNGWGGQDARI